MPGMAPDMMIMGNESGHWIAKECEVDQRPLENEFNPVEIVAAEQGFIRGGRCGEIQQVFSVADLARREYLLKDGSEGRAGRFRNVEEVVGFGWVDRHCSFG